MAANQHRNKLEGSNTRAYTLYFVVIMEFFIRSPMFFFSIWTYIFKCHWEYETDRNVKKKKTNKH